MNENFGIPGVEDKVAELKRKAAEIVSNEADAAALEHFIRVARQKGVEALAAEASPDVDSNGFPKRYFKINVHRGRDRNDLTYVPVQVESVAFKIQRGVDVIVPSVVLEALDHAVSDTTIQVDGGLVFSPSQRFPYQNKGQVTEQDYLAFKERLRLDTVKVAQAA